MNKVVLIGRLGSDPETHWTAIGAQVVTMRIATTDFYTDRLGNKVEQTEWHRVVAFQKTAAQCAQYLVKGRLVCVEGKIQTRKWQDPQGKKKELTEIKVENVQFLDSCGDKRAFTEPADTEVFFSERGGGNDSWGVMESTMDDIPF